MFATIMFINESASEQQLLKNCLKSIKETAYLISAYSEAEALRILSHVQPDCILLDMDVSFTNGYDALKKIRKEERCKEMPVYVIVGKSPRANNSSIFRAADCVYDKPDTADECTDILSDIISRTT